MKQKIVISSLFILCLLIALVAGCTKKNTAKTNSHHSTNVNTIWDYHSGSQPYVDNLFYRIHMEENGFYYIDPWKYMLYFYDYAQKKSIQVCSKPDCEHLSGEPADGNHIVIIGDDQLAEQYKDPVTTCDAYLGYGYGNLTYLANRLYFDMNSFSTNDFMDHLDICSINLDGSNRRIEKKDYIVMNQDFQCPNFYFANGKAIFSHNISDKKEKITSFDLRTKKQITICTIAPNIYWYNEPQMYHEKLYYILWEKEATATSSRYGTLYQYSFDKRKSKEIFKGCIGNYTFINNKIYFTDKKSINTIPLDGGTPVSQFDAPGIDNLSFDGKYLYLDEGYYLPDFSVNNHPFIVCKLDGTKVDNIERTGIPVYGDQNVFIQDYLVEDESNLRHDTLVFMNKSDIGKAHHFYDLITGKEISVHSNKKN